MNRFLKWPLINIPLCPYYRCLAATRMFCPAPGRFVRHGEDFTARGVQLPNLVDTSRNVGMLTDDVRIPTKKYVIYIPSGKLT
jgi:hypothetical protein